jgi:mannitol/fructose-specific phosphotransferase system IIA component (Ntr-type)
MEIILGLLTLEAGIIRQRLFVALVIMAMATSMMSGPARRFILRPAKKKWRLQDALSSKLFLRDLKAVSRHEAITEMSLKVSEVAGLDAKAVEAAVWAREEALSTGSGSGVALPQARIDGLQESLVVVGVSVAGIAFDAPDNKLTNVIFLILTPSKDLRVQLDIASELARLFRHQHMLGRVLRAKSFTDFLALMRASVHSESTRGFTQG